MYYLWKGGGKRQKGTFDGLGDGGEDVVARKVSRKDLRLDLVLILEALCDLLQVFLEINSKLWEKVGRDGRERGKYEASRDNDHVYSFLREGLCKALADAGRRT